MKYDEFRSMDEHLQEIGEGCMEVVHRGPADVAPVLSDRLCAQIHGKGLVEVYDVFPGVEASYHVFSARDATIHHAAMGSVMELFYCRSGRIGWNMRDDIAVYLGAGDMTVHSTQCCADSTMMFPLGYVEGLSLAIDLEKFSLHCPEILQRAKVDFSRLHEMFCGAKPTALPACKEINWIFEPLYVASPSLRMVYLQLKVQELLLYLSGIPGDQKELTQYFSQQTERIKEIHAVLIGHLEQRLTIEELARRYAINASTLKSVFKGVYGLPIATYMKEYRVRQAMKLLRETDLSIAQIAEQVGYESQGKFTKAFKSVAHLLPSEYRKNFSGKVPQ